MAQENIALIIGNLKVNEFDVFKSFFLLVIKKQTSSAEKNELHLRQSRIIFQVLIVTSGNYKLDAVFFLLYVHNFKEFKIYSLNF